MKLLLLDGCYYAYPEGISDLDSFAAYANAHYHQFVELVYYSTDNCVEPYFIAEDVKKSYVNIARTATIEEADGTVLSRAEYASRLAQVVQRKCLDCVNYRDHSDGDNLTGHWDQLSLDGKCWRYEKAED